MSFLDWMVLDEFANIKKGGKLRKELMDPQNYHRFKLAKAKADQQVKMEKVLVQLKNGQKMILIEDPSIVGEIETVGEQKMVYVKDTATTFYLRNSNELDRWKKVS